MLHLSPTVKQWFFKIELMLIVMWSCESSTVKIKDKLMGTCVHLFMWSWHLFERDRVRILSKDPQELSTIRMFSQQFSLLLTMEIWLWDLYNSQMSTVQVVWHSRNMREKIYNFWTIGNMRMHFIQDILSIFGRLYALKKVVNCR